jgi:lipopolysaccharide cholinephosphotransferase
LEAERNLKLKYNQGIFLDIFPLDNICDDVEEGRNHANSILRLKSLSRREVLAVYKKPSFRRNLIMLTIEWGQWLLAQVKKNSHIQLAEKYYNEFIDGMTKYDGSKTENVICYSIFYNDKRRFSREWYEKPVYLDFEWMKVPVCQGYLEYLDQQYGNWREFVMNGSIHGGVFFDTHNPYTKYL